MVTSRDVAQVAGVSQATVSRVLRGAGNVSPETHERVLRALAEIGYVPNQAARTMRTKRTGRIGVVTARLTNPFYPELLDCLTAELDAAGHHTVLWNSEGPGEESAVEAIRQRAVDAVIFTTATARSRSLLEAMEKGSPVVLVNRGVAGMPVDQVASDNEVGAAAVAEYFAKYGRRRVAVFSGSLDASTSVLREQGFVRAARRLGLELPSDFIIEREFSHEDGRAAMQALLDRDDPPTAVFCANDLIAFGAVDAARSAGVRIPDDLWLVGFDDIEMSRWSAYDLTTVRQETTLLARAAVELALARIAAPRRPAENRTFACELIVRGSTGHARP